MSVHCLHALKILHELHKMIYSYSEDVLIYFDFLNEFNIVNKMVQKCYYIYSMRFKGHKRTTHHTVSSNTLLNLKHSRSVETTL